MNCFEDKVFVSMFTLPLFTANSIGQVPSVCVCLGWGQREGDAVGAKQTVCFLWVTTALIYGLAPSAGGRHCPLTPGRPPPQLNFIFLSYYFGEVSKLQAGGKDDTFVSNGMMNHCPDVFISSCLQLYTVTTTRVPACNCHLWGREAAVHVSHQWEGGNF